MRIRARARQKGVELPLIISDHADWDDLQATIREVQAGEIWITHGEAEALAHWCGTLGLKGMPLHLVGYGDEGEAERQGRLGVAAHRCSFGCAALRPGEDPRHLSVPATGTHPRARPRGGRPRGSWRRPAS